MNRDIHEGFVTARHKIGGVVLAPYSAAHAFALEASGWSLADLATPQGVLRFVDICRRPVGPDCLPSGWLRSGPGWRLSAWAVALAAVPSLHKEAVKAVHDYLADCLATPRVDRPETAKMTAGPNGSDILFRVITALKMGISEHRAWSMPLGALNNYLVHKEALENKESIIADPEEEEMFAEEFRRICQ